MIRPEKWPNRTTSRAIFALVAIMVALGAYLTIFTRKESRPIAPVEAPIVEDALSRQAEHERDDVVNVRSSNAVRVRQIGQNQCVELQNRAAGVSSSYCYQAGEGRWKLVSERVGTR